ncbi:MAG: GldG family protein [Polyangiaceae bacterium]|nr:GldG family protein [Polyangiaceae bacterium]
MLLLVAASLFFACGAQPTPAPTTPAPTTAAAPTPRASAAPAHGISEASKRLLRSLGEPVHLDVIITRGVPYVDAYLRDLERLLAAYSAAAPGKIEIRVLDGKEPVIAASAKRSGLAPVALVEHRDLTVDDDGIVPVYGYFGVVLSYGKATGTIKSLQPTDRLGVEYLLSAKIRELREEAQAATHRIGVVGGHGEDALSATLLVPPDLGRANLDAIVAQNFPYYRFETVDLNALDDDLAALIVTQPQRPYTEKELRRIDQFLMRGKAVAVFASASSSALSDARMRPSLDSRGLERLLAGYGIEMRRDAVTDPDAFTIDVMQVTGPSRIPFPGIPLAQNESQRLDTSFAPLFRLPQLAMPFASSLVLHPEKQPDAVRCAGLAPEVCAFKVVVRTGPRAVSSSSAPASFAFDLEWQSLVRGPTARFDLGAVVQGHLTSAFAPSDAPVRGAPPARLLVLASSQFLVNPFVRATAAGAPKGTEALQIAGPYAQQVLTQTIMAFKQTLDWLTADPELSALAAKEL